MALRLVTHSQPVSLSKALGNLLFSFHKYVRLSLSLRKSKSAITKSPGEYMNPLVASALDFSVDHPFHTPAAESNVLRTHSETD